MVWGVVLPRVTPLVAARTAVLGFGMGVLCASRQLPALMSSVVTILGSGWKAGHLHQTSHAGSALWWENCSFVGLGTEILCLLFGNIREVLGR